MKSSCVVDINNTTIVSLFTREWIEISAGGSPSGVIVVSLFTREWIEIIYPRISGDIAALSLPLYEGVD